MTVDHKVLNEEGESRNNHRHAVVVQDLVTEWVQSHPCKTQTSQETERSLRNFLEPWNVLTIPWNLAKLVKIYPGIIVHQRLTDLGRMVLLEERYAELKTELLLHSCNLDWVKWWADSTEKLPSAKCSRPLGKWEDTV